jgi:hypothetical protein
MNGFVAIVLICLNTVPQKACTEETASDVLSTVVDSELDCNFGWQEIVGRSPLAGRIGSTAYVKTLCRRAPDGTGPPGAEREKD